MKFWNTERLAELSRMANGGIPNADVAQHFGKSAPSIAQTLYFHKILSKDSISKRASRKAHGFWDTLTGAALSSVESSKDSVEMAYCLGALMGDGCVSSSGHSTIAFINVTDEAFACEFERCLGVVIGSRPKFNKRYVKRTSYIAGKAVNTDSDFFWVGTCFKKASLRLRELLDPSFILSHGDEFLSAFLRGSFDSDGSVPRMEKNPRRWAVCIRVDSESEANLIADCLAKLEIGYSRHVVKPKADGLKAMHGVLIRSHASILKFYEKVGFTTTHRRERLQQIVDSLGKVA